MIASILVSIDHRLEKKERISGMKWFVWLSKLLIISFIAAAVSVVTTFSMVNLYAGGLLKQFHLEAAVPSLKISDLIASFTRPMNTMETAASHAEGSASSQPPQANGSSAADVLPQEDTASAANNADSTQPTTPPAGDALPVFGASKDSLSQSASSTDQQKVLVSAEELMKKKDSMSAEDKMKIFSLLSKLPQEQMQQISKWVEDGITVQEMSEIQNVIRQNVTDKEYQEIMQILQKY